MWPGGGKRGRKIHNTTDTTEKEQYQYKDIIENKPSTMC